MLSKILLIGMLAASAIDFGSTEYALSHPGLREGNPLMCNRGVRITVSVVAPIAIYKLVKDKPVKAQLIATVPYIGLKTFAGVHNIKLAKKESKG